MNLNHVASLARYLYGISCVMNIHLALVRIGSTLCQSWSVMCGMPDSARPYSWCPCLDRNLCRASSLRLSELSRSRAIKFRVFPSSVQAFSTLSLKLFSWPALRKRSPGILVNMSIRHSVDRSVAVTSSSWTLDFSHSTCITNSLCRSKILHTIWFFEKLTKKIYLFELHGRLFTLSF